MYRREIKEWMAEEESKWKSNSEDSHRSDYAIREGSENSRNQDMHSIQ